MIHKGDHLSLCNCMKNKVKFRNHPTALTKDRQRCLYCGSFVYKMKAGEKEVNAFNNPEFKPKLEAAKWNRLLSVLKEIKERERMR